jgi:hypothetical protein
LALALALPLLGTLGAADPLVSLPAVRVATAPDLDCPNAAGVERVLAATRGPAVPPQENGDGPWTLFMERLGAEVRITLREPGGAPVLSRLLTAPPPRCESTSAAIGIVVERYFRSLAWLPEGERTAGTSPAPARAAETPPTTAVMTALQPQPRPRFFANPPRFVAGIGPALWTRGGAAMLLDTRLRIAGPVVVGIGTLLPPFRIEGKLPQTAIGQAHTSGVPVLARIAVAGAHGRWGGTLGIETLLTFEKGQSEAIASPASAWRTVLAAGLTVGGSVALGTTFRVSADAAAYRTVLGRSFEIDTIPGPLLEPPPWQAVFALRLEWIAFP